MIFTDWISDQPDNEGGVENCIEIFTALEYKWNDQKCWKLNNFICEHNSPEFNFNIRSDI